MDAANKNRKWCIVPECLSTSTRNPGKTFFYVPYEKKKRILWITSVRRNPSEFGKTSSLYVCEDHFNLENDMENYIKYKLVGGNKKLKANVVPHIFVCQSDRKRAAPGTPRTATIKRCRQQLVNEILSSDSAIINQPTIENEPVNDTVVESNPSTPARNEKATQTISPTRIHFRSRYVQCNGPMKKNAACSPFKICKDSATSPLQLGITPKIIKDLCVNSDSSSSSSSNVIFSSDESDYLSETSNTDDLDEISVNNEIKKQSLERMLKLIPKQPRLYLGLPKETFFLINTLLKYATISARDMYITLKKIRTAHTFAELANDFGMSEGNASKIFGKSVTKLSANLSKFVLWPSKRQIKRRLPIAFIANYSNVQSIIDCLEIEIDKPTNSIHQSLTWSDYKQANTLKYLISATPNGFINFISTGFGGRASDALIVEESGYLKKIPLGSVVMADRGFKHIEHLLMQNTCTLVRPPSVIKGQKSSKAEVLETKRIASLRIHVERVIRRLREFKMLKQHACISPSLLKYMDHIIVIACALSNFQGSLIKK